ncbi:MAG: hypothetical protein RJA22_2866, partial [Verrucomicrobiota bacterium]
MRLDSPSRESMVQPRMCNMKTFLCVALLAAGTLPVAAADPRVDSWLTTGTSRYARLYETDADLAAGTT